MASGQGSSLKLAAAVKLLADYLFLTNEKSSAMEYYKEALARVEARTEHDRAKPQTQSFSAQVRWRRRGRCVSDRVLVVVVVVVVGRWTLCERTLFCFCRDVSPPDDKTEHEKARLAC